MFKRFTALIWLRREIIWANKQIVIQILMPILMVALYQFMYKDLPIGDKNEMILFLVLPMVYGFVGFIVALIISEENEKHNLRSLQLSGVGTPEYLLANLVYPFFIQLFYIVALPIYLQQSFSKLGGQYIIVNIVTSLVTLLIYLLLGILSNTQSKASIASLPIMLGISFLPLFAIIEKSLEKWIALTFMGAFIKYSKQLADFPLFSQASLILLLWLVLLLLLIVWALKRIRLQK
ncbi:ABC transporter permease [Streptococcus ferus]|uniref:ABC transporter permease n=1 Tax=Streptococcus ferus TaxID=1345 RepID=UPI00359FD51B